MADRDLQVAMDLPTSLNANLRRVSPRLAQREMRAAKRPCIGVDALSLTSQSMPPSTPPQGTETLTFQSMLPPTPPQSTEAHTTQLMISSTPPQLAELQNPLLPSTQLQASEGQPSEGQALDAMLPLQAPAPQSTLPSTPPQPTDAVHSINNDEGSSPLSSIQTPQSLSGHFMNDQSDTLLESVSPARFVKVQLAQPRTRRQRGKHAKDDDEFLPYHEAQDDPEDVVQPEKATGKSKTAGKRKAATLKIVTAPYHVNNQVGKPEPYGQPSVWADKRQQLCETVPYYKAYQGSAYTNHGIVFALLIDKETSLRDKFEEEVIITSVLVLSGPNFRELLIKNRGGGRTTDENGKRVRKQDQPKRKSEPFLNSMKSKLPIAVIAGMIDFQLSFSIFWY